MAVTNYHTVNGRILGETTGGIRTDYLTDALGSVTATVNPSGQVVNRYTYKPYGGYWQRPAWERTRPTNGWEAWATGRRARSILMCMSVRGTMIA
jgi:hypothetical protein